MASLEELPFTGLECLAAIKKLGLTKPELRALQTQGFVAGESRGRRTTIYRLRFRFAGRQQSKYIGTDRRAGMAIQVFLDRHQQARRVDQRLRSRMHKIKQMLRTAKTAVGPYLTEAGLHYHGNSLRRSRTMRGEPSSQTDEAIGNQHVPTSI